MVPLPHPLNTDQQLILTHGQSKMIIPQTIMVKMKTAMGLFTFFLLFFLILATYLCTLQLSIYIFRATITGSYYVALPDGRLQKVTYSVDAYGGYVADVSYEGK